MGILTDVDLSALWVSVRLATMTVIVLLIVGTPLAWWLAHTRSRLRPIIEAAVALPIVLPPTVLGFYILIALGPYGPLGRLADLSLAFTFPGWWLPRSSTRCHLLFNHCKARLKLLARHR